MMNRPARLRRLQRAFGKGCIASTAEVDAAIAAKLNKREPWERKRILRQFLGAQGLSVGTAEGPEIPQRNRRVHRNRTKSCPEENDDDNRP